MHSYTPQLWIGRSDPRFQDLRHRMNFPLSQVAHVIDRTLPQSAKVRLEFVREIHTRCAKIQVLCKHEGGVGLQLAADGIFSNSS